MAKKPVKRKISSKRTKKTSSKSKNPKTSRLAVKSRVKKTLTQKEISERAANVIASSERKKSVKKSKRPTKSSTNKETSTLLNSIVDGMQEKKAKNIMILNLTAIENRVADYFVISDAESKTHVESIAESVEETVMKQTSEKPYHSEGKQNSEWILVDYINIVAHVFLREFRDTYNLEALWGDAEITLINN